MWVYIFCSIKTPCSSWFTFQICLMPPRPSSPTIPVHSMVIFLGLWLLSTAGKFLLDIGGLLAHMTPPSVLLGHNAFYTNLFAWLILTFSCFSLTRKTWEEEKKKKCGKCLRVHFQEQRVERGGGSGRVLLASNVPPMSAQSQVKEKKDFRVTSIWQNVTPFHDKSTEKNYDLIIVEPIIIKGEPKKHFLSVGGVWALSSRAAKAKGKPRIAVRLTVCKIKT